MRRGIHRELGEWPGGELLDSRPPRSTACSTRCVCRSACRLAKKDGVAPDEIKKAADQETEKEIKQLVELIADKSEDRDSKIAELNEYVIVLRAAESPELWDRENIVIEKLETRDGWDRTPLYMAVLNGHYQTAELLISAKAVRLLLPPCSLPVDSPCCVDEWRLLC